jgi:hypothetical protein
MVGHAAWLAYLSATNVVAILLLLPMNGRDEDAEILALRHLITALERQLVKTCPPPPIEHSSQHCFTDSPRQCFVSFSCWYPETLLRNTITNAHTRRFLLDRGSTQVPR